jgi:hypothetical protein
MHSDSMTNAKSVTIGALIVAAAILLAAWWTRPQQPAYTRFELVNVGNGETQRIDRLDGTVIRCVYGQCKALTDGAKPVNQPPGLIRSGDKEIPLPPPGYKLVE